MKKLVLIFTLLFMMLMSVSFAETPFTIEEETWLDENVGQTFVLGFDPFSGMDYFEFRGSTYGFLIDAVEIFNAETGLNIVIDDSLTWGKAYSGLFDRDIDILFGANATEERLKTMVFTDSIHAYPYTILTNKKSPITTLGDIDGKVVGFIEGDIVKEELINMYDNIHVISRLYDDQHSGMEALSLNEIDAFVTSGGEVVWDYLYQYPDIHEVVELSSIQSEMTFSTLKENDILISILDKIIEDRKGAFEKKVVSARHVYVRKILRLTPSEQEWLSADPSIVIGVPNDYLPIDHYENGQYTGVAGEYLNQYSDLLGVHIVAVSGSFDEMYEALEKGQIDLLNMAKTDDRAKVYMFTHPFSNERDNIYGLRSSDYVHDIYGLEGYRVAVIEGFWHEEHLKKNLQNVTIVTTKDISETLDLINKKEVDYFIENPTVSDYYIDQLGYNNIAVRGETSADSYLYFGTHKENSDFVTSFNKSMLLMDYDKAKYEGIQKSPRLDNVFNTRLRKILVVMGVVLLLVIFLLFRMVRSTIIQRADLAVMKEREQLMYTDILTGLNNRLYFNEYTERMDDMLLPQGMVVMDLNDLKKTNDTFGHQAGDAYIKAFSKYLLTLIDSDQIMRMGGDEFLICLPNVTLDEIEALVQKVKKECPYIEYTLEDDTLMQGIYTSVGYALRYDLGTTVDDLFHTADKRMYEDKESSKGK